MTDRVLYTLAIPSGAQKRTDPQAQQQTSQQGILGSDTGSVESIATQPGEEMLFLAYRGKFAEKMAAEVTELMQASGVDSVAYFAPTSTTPDDGYYTISAAPSARQDPKFPDVVTANLSLTSIGTRASHRRAVKTDIGQPNHPFGNDQTAYLGVPATASKVRWYDPDASTLEQPTLVETRSAEFGDIDIFDAQSSSYTNPEIVFDLPYDEEGKTDPRVYDARGFADRADGDGVLQWAKVFIGSHDFEGDAVLSNGLIRLTVDESASSLTVEEWNDGTSNWDSVALGTSDWGFYDLDVRKIGLAEIEAVVEFEDTTQSPTAYYPLRMMLKRGWENPLWTELDGQGGTPQGVEDLLTPVASASAYDPGENQGLRKRSEL